MGFKVIFSDNFVNDLRDITSYISKDNPQAAITLGDALISEALSLDEHPNRGSKIRGRSGARKLVYKSYLIIYEIHGQTVEILGCIHGSRIQ